MDDLRAFILTACPFIGWKRTKVGKRGGKIMLALGIILTASWVTLFVVLRVLNQWICSWLFVVWMLALAAGILLRRGWEYYRRG